ncbi:protein-tyrosine phosphatase-like protein [Amylocystis lapponica]|nr:protein-tyrosine phosphatase-like protein [Amylocystis lapponica]
MDLDPLDPVYVSERLSKPPFVAIEGVVNVRDLGSYPTGHAGLATRPRFLYRSAEIFEITEQGVAQLKALGISKVFDLRSDTEVDRYEAPCPDIDGVEVVRTPVFKTEDYSPEMMAKCVSTCYPRSSDCLFTRVSTLGCRRYALYASGKTEAFMELYSQILDHGGPAFGEILRHVRDRPTEACLFHCTAGKDRTGVIAAILLKLAGVGDTMVAEDYALTRVGREPARQKVMARLAKVPMFATNTEAALNMLSSRPETMIAFLALLQDRYGGVEEYIKTYLHLTTGDIETIRQNILVSSSN